MPPKLLFSTEEQKLIKQARTSVRYFRQRLEQCEDEEVWENCSDMILYWTGVLEAYREEHDEKRWGEWAAQKRKHFEAVLERNKTKRGKTELERKREQYDRVNAYRREKRAKAAAARRQAAVQGALQRGIEVVRASKTINTPKEEVWVPQPLTWD